MKRLINRKVRLQAKKNLSICILTYFRYRAGRAQKCARVKHLHTDMQELK